MLLVLSTQNKKGDWKTEVINNCSHPIEKSHFHLEYERALNNGFGSWRTLRPE